ncbi:MAG: hypothetical protein WEE89_15350 [Gemmatimonadota bacterium]
MSRITRFALAVLMVPLAAAAQNPAQPTCADVNKEIDKYADQEVSFYGKINSIEIRDGAMLMVFACVTAGGEMIPDAFFGVAVASGSDSLLASRGELNKGLMVTGVVRATNTMQIFRNPPSFRGPYLHAATFKPIG